jgi:uncharacterized RDD family membrane protein YckC
MTDSSRAPVTLAPLWRRLGAALYELLLVVAILFIAGFALLPLVSPHAPGSPAALALPDLPSRVIVFCAMFAVNALYFTWFWSKGRQTLPQKTWRLRVVDAAGAPLATRQALARYLATWIGPALAVGAYAALASAGWGGHAAWFVASNFLWAWVDRDRQFLHDRVAGTRVVDCREIGIRH